MHNALKHAHARRIELTLSFAPDQVALDVRDDGVGFDAEAYRGSDGSGLHSMRERIRRIGGTLHIDSAPGQGTHVHVTV